MYNYFCKPTSIEIYRKFKRSVWAVYENLPAVTWIDPFTPLMVLMDPSKYLRLTCENKISASSIVSSNKSDQALKDAVAFDIED